MPLAGNHTFNTVDLTAYSPSVGGTPVAAYMRVPFTGTVRKITCIIGAAITTANGLITVTNATQGTTLGTIAIVQSGSAAGQYQFTALPTGANTTIQVNEDDVLVFTPSLASGASVPGHFSAAIRCGY